MSEVLRALVPGGGGVQRLPRIVPLGIALEILLTGDMIDAQEAHRIGLVNKVVPHDKLMEESLALAKKIASKPPLAVRMMKRAVQEASTGTLRSHLDYISSQLALLSQTEDHMEAARAFLEKRQPVFTGK